MTRDEEIIQAAIDYTKATRPNAIGGDAFSNLVDAMNVNPSFIVDAMNVNHSFIDGAKWADSHPCIQWHNISDELPPISKKRGCRSIAVLVTDGSMMDVGFYVYSIKDWLFTGFIEVTHWAYLPKLPKDVKL